MLVIHRDGEEFVRALRDQWVAADRTVFAVFKNFVGYQSDDDSEQTAGFDRHGDRNMSVGIATGHEDEDEWVTEDEDEWVTEDEEGSVQNESQDGAEGDNEDNGVDSAVEDGRAECNAE